MKLSPLTDPDASPIAKLVYYCGGAIKVGKALGISHQAVYRWVWKNAVPAERVVELEGLCQGFITREQLRPDIYSGVKRTKTAAPAEEVETSDLVLPDLALPTLV